ncbi:hypothetical protein EYF80_010235 [Liparis tanakae]|uniref:Uncharacterized protein n=1 Tax=Liparis tanakae TaxID=230148 RepID=A0A4Z2INM9_9TELE|nr:hypothetical protein EYF80_010235 [Liparis tanakae]
MEARRDLGFEDQKHPVGFHEDARDAEDEADPEGRLPYAARPVLRLADEDEGAGEATDEREQEDVGQLSVRGLHYRGVAESDEDSHDEGGQEHTQHRADSQRYPERNSLKPGMCPALRAKPIVPATTSRYSGLATREELAHASLASQVRSVMFLLTISLIKGSISGPLANTTMTLAVEFSIRSASAWISCSSKY